MGMRGTILQLKADGSRSTLSVVGPPTLDALQAAIGGGYLELVPQFNTLREGEHLIRCVAFCDEEGKLKNLPFNHQATTLWREAQQRAGGYGLLSDVLVGSVAIVFGDRDFMGKL
jgi:hypothetical protein